MYEDLFVSAYMSVIIAADFQEYLEMGTSVIMNILASHHLAEDQAETTLFTLGNEAQAVSAVYLECFSAFGIADEFDDWTADQKRMDEVYDLLSDALEAGLIEAAVENSSRFDYTKLH